MNIVVNGGSQGIGKEVALYLAQDSNNHIIVTGRNEQALRNLSSVHKNVHALTIDLSVFDTQIEYFRESIAGYFESVDILINVAGMIVAKEFMNISSDESRLMMETNFFGPASVIRILKPIMPKGSHVINISSMGGFQGSSKYTGLSYYSASKAALSCLSECLSKEFMEDGISVNCLALGAVQTEMLEEAFPGYKAPVEANEMGRYIAEFALTGNKFFNGKVIPVAVNNP